MWKGELGLTWGGIWSHVMGWWLGKVRGKGIVVWGP